MSGRAVLRAGAGLLLVGLLALSVWRCAEEPTGSIPSGMQLDLRRSGPPGAPLAEVESLEIEVWRAGVRVAAETLRVGPGGAFSWLLALDAGDDYLVRAFGWGVGAHAWPDSAPERGLVCLAPGTPVAVSAGRVTRAGLDLAPADPVMRDAQGRPGEDSLRASWSPVPGATAYELAWRADSNPVVERAAATGDTAITVPWDEAGRALLRARARFGAREGVFGAGLWCDTGAWLDLPRLTSVSPAPGSTVQPDAFFLRLAFDRAMAASTLRQGVLWTLEPDSQLVDYAFAADDASNASFRLEPAPGAQIRMGATYELRITPRLTDATGRPFDADPDRAGAQDTVLGYVTAPYAPLRVIGVQPADGALDAPRRVRVRVALNRMVQASSVTPVSFRVLDAAGRPIPGTTTLLGAPDTLAWAPASPLWFAAACTVRVTDELRDADGGRLDQDPLTLPPVREPFVASFRTLEQPEGPRVIAVQPAAGATGVSRDAAVRVEFSEPIDTTRVKKLGSFSVRQWSDQYQTWVGIRGGLRPEADRRSLVFAPTDRLRSGVAHRVEAHGAVDGDSSAGVADLDGHLLDQDPGLPEYQPFVAHFRVETPPAVSGPPDFEPSRPDTFAARDATLRLEFTRAIDPETLTEATVELRRGTQPVPLAIHPGADSLTVRLVPASPLEPEARYGVWVDTLVATRDGSRLDQAPDTRHHQPYRAFFTAQPESLHPRVAAVWPAPGDTQAAVTDTVRVEFSAPIDPASATAQSVRLRRVTDPPADVPAVVTAQERSAQLIPSDSLEYRTEYEISVSSAVLSRNRLFPLDQDPGTPGLQAFASRFTTAPERIAPWVQASYPPEGALDVPVDVVVGVDFSEPMRAGTVVEALGLWRGPERVPGTTGLDPSGRHATFAPSDPLAWREPYALRVETGALDLEGNALDQDPTAAGAQPFAIGFRTRNESTAPRVVTVAPADGASDIAVSSEVRLEFSEPLARASVTPLTVGVAAGGEGVAGRLTLGPSDSVVVWYPIDPADSSRVPLAFGQTYRVEATPGVQDLWDNALDQDPGQPGPQAFVAFFSTQPETLAPRVLELQPEGDDVPVDVQPRLVFSEPMDSVSLASPGVVRLRAGDDPVPVALELSAGRDTLILVPEQPLEPSRTHTLTVSTQATDRAGNPLDQDPTQPGAQGYEGAFRTAEDVEPPRVLQVTPADGVRHAAPETAVEIVFSERVDPGTVHAGSVYLTGPHGIVALSEGPSPDGTGARVRLRPAAPLEEGADYGVLATRLVTDLVGHPLDQDPARPGAQDFASLFRVGTRPRIVWAGGRCEPGDTARAEFDAAASYDPDADDSVAVAVWDWGDGARDTLAAPAGLTAAHDYGCQDLRGCDAADNDGDGTADETGPDGCDESYRVILTLADAHGLARADTAGVAFCAFQVLETRPAEGDSVAMGDTLRLALSHDVALPASDAGVTLARLGDGEPLGRDLLRRDSGRALLVVPHRAFEPGDYRLTLDSGVVDGPGRALDQDPCLPGRQPFRLTFHGPRRPPLPPLEDDRSDRAPGE